MNVRRLLLATLAVAAALPLSAQFTGSDDFSSSANWSDGGGAGTGALAIGGGQMEYTVSSASGDSSRFFAWTPNSGSWTTDWSVQVDVHFSTLGLTTEGQYANLNLVIAESVHPTTNNFSVAIDRYRDASTTQRNFESYLHVGGTPTPLGSYSLASGDAALAISFNSTTKVLTALFDGNGSIGGYSWTSVGTADVSTVWGGLSGNPFTAVLAGGSSGIAITSGSATYDNFATSASAITPVPEPATYAAILGALVGLVAVIRRRRA